MYNSILEDSNTNGKTSIICRKTGRINVDKFYFSDIYGNKIPAPTLATESTLGVPVIILIGQINIQHS